MKKTTSDKPCAYISRITTEHDALTTELEDAEEALSLAKADYAKKEEVRAGFNNPHNFTHEEHRASIEESAAKNHVDSIKSNISNLKRKIAPLHLILSAPERFTEAKKALEALQVSAPIEY